MAEAKATFGAGCFWCVEAVFQRVAGVISVMSGYAGGARPNPTYEMVCTGTTGHAEVCQITYNPKEVSFADLLLIFWRVHNPTTLNQQGNDAGTQYRSVVFYHDETQRIEAEKMKGELQASGVWNAPIVTEIAPLTRFYPAEQYHQDYFNCNFNQPYCQMVIAPKLEKFVKTFRKKLKEN